jgi:hypothetical protein
VLTSLEPYSTFSISSQPLQNRPRWDTLASNAMGLNEPAPAFEGQIPDLLNAPRIEDQSPTPVNAPLHGYSPIRREWMNRPPPQMLPLANFGNDRTKKALSVDSPAFTPATLSVPGKTSTISSQAANAAPFTPRGLASGKCAYGRM